MIEIDSNKGLKIFHNSSFKNQLLLLLPYIYTQQRYNSCSIAVISILLSYFNKSWYTEDYIAGMIDYNYPLTLTDMNNVLIKLDFNCHIIRGNRTNLKQFRNYLKYCLRTINKFMVVNYCRYPVNNISIPHFVIVVGYSEEHDRALILETQRRYYKPGWIKISQILDGMQSVDMSDKKYRGFVIIEKN